MIWFANPLTQGTLQANCSFTNKCDPQTSRHVLVKRDRSSWETEEKECGASSDAKTENHIAQNGILLAAVTWWSADPADPKLVFLFARCEVSWLLVCAPSSNGILVVPLNSNVILVVAVILTSVALSFKRDTLIQFKWTVLPTSVGLGWVSPECS